MLESIQKLVPWMSDLPTLPKVGMTIIIVLVGCIVLYLVWVPLPSKSPADETRVKDAYARMQRVLSRIGGSSDHITVDGQEVGAVTAPYYRSYWTISQYVSAHPGDIKGAYDNIWENGGQNRSFINDTETFEAVVSGFMIAWEVTAHNNTK
ncbi:MAG: hypothetical protein QOD11_3395 [Bradyrhizobium sp.]|jgi:hypothetical protein|nr:hypothetical protein [Bradyrhizobium sp.]